MDKDKPMCVSCGRELAPRDVLEAVVHSFCRKASCVARSVLKCAQRLLEGVPFEQWLDEMCARKSTH
jgi:hypothetical protein